MGISSEYLMGSYLLASSRFGHSGIKSGPTNSVLGTWESSPHRQSHHLSRRMQEKTQNDTTVSIYGGFLKWWYPKSSIYTGKSIYKWMIWGTPIVGNLHMLQITPKRISARRSKYRYWELRFFQPWIQRVSAQRLPMAVLRSAL